MTIDCDGPQERCLLASLFNGTRKPTIQLHFTYLVDKYSRRLRFLFFIMSCSSILVENAVYVSRIILLLFSIGRRNADLIIVCAFDVPIYDEVLKNALKALNILLYYPFLRVQLVDGTQGELP